MAPADPTITAITNASPTRTKATTATKNALCETAKDSVCLLLPQSLHGRPGRSQRIRTGIISFGPRPHQNRALQQGTGLGVEAYRRRLGTRPGNASSISHGARTAPAGKVDTPLRGRSQTILRMRQGVHHWRVFVCSCPGTLRGLYRDPHHSFFAGKTRCILGYGAVRHKGKRQVQPVGLCRRSLRR